jgi:hypothetical protein
MWLVGPTADSVQDAYIAFRRTRLGRALRPDRRAADRLHHHRLAHGAGHRIRDDAGDGVGRPARGAGRDDGDGTAGEWLRQSRRRGKSGGKAGERGPAGDDHGVLPHARPVGPAALFMMNRSRSLSSIEAP